MCRDVFGPKGRLIEITSAEVQELAVEVIRAAEATFTIGDPELSYWWSGLRDEDDDKQWVWETSKMMISNKTTGNGSLTLADSLRNECWMT